MFYYQSPILGICFSHIQPFLETERNMLIIYTINKIHLIEFENTFLIVNAFVERFSFRCNKNTNLVLILYCQHNCM